MSSATIHGDALLAEAVQALTDLLHHPALEMCWRPDGPRHWSDGPCLSAADVIAKSLGEDQWVPGLGMPSPTPQFIDEGSE